MRESNGCHRIGSDARLQCKDFDMRRLVQIDRPVANDFSRTDGTFGNLFGATWLSAIFVLSCFPILAYPDALVLRACQHAQFDVAPVMEKFTRVREGRFPGCWMSTLPFVALFQTESLEVYMNHFRHH